MNANKIIHEKITKKCWHIKSTERRFGAPVCYQCDSIMQPNPDYTDPVHYCALMDWMREKVGRHQRQRLLLFVQYMESKGMEAVRFFGLPIKKQINLIAEAIESGGLR